MAKEIERAGIPTVQICSMAEVARACEVNPNVLYRWRRELREYGAKAFRRCPELS